MLCTFAACWLLAPLGIADAPPFDDLFTGRTLRLDYYHSGTRGEERISLDQLRLEGDWPGSRVRRLDDTGLGLYLLVVERADTGEAIYSRGSCSVFGEWQTTGEAGKGRWKTFHESQRMPEPRLRCRIVLQRRGPESVLETIFTTEFDPEDARTSTPPPPSRAGRCGASSRMEIPRRRSISSSSGTATRLRRMREFHADAGRLVGVLFEAEPFRSRRTDFNVWAIDVPATTSGVSDPRKGRWVETPLGLSFDAFGLPRYMLTESNRSLREIASLAPHDTIVLLANSSTYGGGGIYNLWATCAARNPRASYVFVHEIGHSFAGLADEYYTSRVAYEDLDPIGVEPSEPNITALLDPAKLKWRDLVADGTPLPTPWAKDAFEKMSAEEQSRREKLLESGEKDAALDAHAAESGKRLAPLLEGGDRAGIVGAFEGACLPRSRALPPRGELHHVLGHAALLLQGL